MEDYHIKTIAQIRARNSRLNQYDDKAIASLYRAYSAETACAGWLDSTPERVIDCFIKWALTAPADLFMSEEHESWKKLLYDTLFKKFNITPAAIDSAMQEIADEMIAQRMKEMDDILKSFPQPK